MSTDPRPFTLRGLAAELAERGIKSNARAVWVFVHAEGLSFKKALLPEEQTRPDVARRRARWKAHQGRIAPERLVFIDETWIKTNMAPLRGWGPKGKPLRGLAPHGHWRTLTFLGALRFDRLTAPCVSASPIAYGFGLEVFRNRQGMSSSIWLCGWPLMMASRVSAR